MSVDLQDKGYGRTHVSLGPVEKWGVTAIGAAVIGVGWWLVTSMQAVLTQQAVTNQQLTNIGAQLTDVPQLRSQNAELKVRVDRLESDVKELRSMRNLK